MRRFFLFFLGIPFVLVIGIVTFLLFGLNPAIKKFEPQIEARLSQVMGKDISVNGPMEVTFFPRLTLNIKDIKVTEERQSSLEAEELILEFSRFPLKEQIIQIESIYLNNPKVEWRQRQREKSAQETVSSARPQKFWHQFLPSVNSIEVMELNIHSARVTVYKPDGDMVLTTEGLNLQSGDIHLRQFSDISKGWRHLLQTNPFRLNASAQLVETRLARLDELSMEIENNAGILTFSSIKMKLGGGNSDGRVVINLLGEQFDYYVVYHIKDVDLAKIINKASSKIKLQGQVNANLNLKTRGQTLKTIISGLTGEFEMEVAELVIPNLDIDGLLDNYQKSQRLDLFDIGAFVLGGPLGLLMTKSYDVSGLIMNNSSKMKTNVKQLSFDVKVENGVVGLRDVAFATQKNRVAGKGKIDLNTMTFKKVEVAILNNKGCSKYAEILDGSATSPQVDSLSYLGKVLISPLSSLLNKVTDLVSDSCSVFYQGRVKPASI